MPYLGKSPQHGNYSKLDDFSGDFDGSDATHALASNSIAITPVRPEALLIYINGVAQEPVADYTVSGTNITFTTAPTLGDNFSGVAMGEQLQIGTPSDATVTSAKLSGNLTTPGTLTVTDSALISGTTPTLTIGDAGAEDTKIVFDGNAQDYYIGLDDTDDDFKIGLGSTLGTTTHMAFTEDGEITKPLQPTFMAIPASLQSNISINAYTTIAFGTERFDVGANFATPNFTAPVTGKYWLGVDLYLANIDSDANYYNLFINTSNKEYGITWSVLALDQDANYWQMALSTVADMDAGDTAYVRMYQSAGTSQTDINTANSHFAGYLLG